MGPVTTHSSAPGNQASGSKPRSFLGEPLEGACGPESDYRLDSMTLSPQGPFHPPDLRSLAKEHRGGRGEAEEPRRCDSRTWGQSWTRAGRNGMGDGKGHAVREAVGAASSLLRDLGHPGQEETLPVPLPSCPRALRDQRLAHTQPCRRFRTGRNLRNDPH